MSMTVEFNPFDKSWWAEPYDLYRRLLDHAPVGQIPIIDITYFARYDDCASILRDPRFGVDNRKSTLYQQFIKPTMPQEGDQLAHSFLFLDPPDHTRLRSLVSRAFTPRVVEQLTSRIEDTVCALLDQISSPSFDAIADFAYPLPITVICDLLGVPQEDRTNFHDLSRHLVAGLDPELMVPPDVLVERRSAMLALRSYMAGLIAKRRSHPEDDLVSALVSHNSTADQMTEDELTATFTLLLVAGYETTVNLIGNALLAFAREPSERRALLSNEALLPQAIEEVLRFDPPVQLTSRVVGEDLSLAGRDLPKGAIVLVLIAAANRDGQHFSHPDRLDINRSDIRHLSFSLGAHHCLGAPLARSEARIALREVLRRFPDYELSELPRYRETLVLRGIEQLALSTG